MRTVYASAISRAYEQPYCHCLMLVLPGVMLITSADLAQQLQVTTQPAAVQPEAQHACNSVESTLWWKQFTLITNTITVPWVAAATPLA